MLRALAWLGHRAQWLLAIGVIGALAFPAPGVWLAGTLPLWIAILIGLAMTRIDLALIARRMMNPLRLIRNLALCIALMAATPTVFWFFGSQGGLPTEHIEALVYTGSGPPLGSAAAFCLILGLDAAFALEITVVGSFLAPLTMPLMARILLGEAVPIDTIEMSLRLSILIGAALAGAIAARRILGAVWIEHNGKSFDGLSSVILIIFLFPLFLGIPDLIRLYPGFALATLLLAIAANLGVQLIVYCCLRSSIGRDTAGAIALTWGNRNAALALAALPEAPFLTLYVALYQFPMYFTPLVMRPVVGRK